MKWICNNVINVY